MAKGQYYRYSKSQESGKGDPTRWRTVERVNRSKADARKTYDRFSRWYDLLADPFEKEFRQIGLQKLNLQPEEFALDIGFGTGQAILSMAEEVGPRGKVYGVDISERMTQKTRLKVVRSGMGTQVELVCSDGANLPLDDNFFDAVFMSFTLELFDNDEIPLCLFECQRVLRSSGRLCVVAMSKEDEAGIMVRLYEWLHRRFPRWLDCRPIYLESALATAGFAIIDSSRKTIGGLPVNIVLANRSCSIEF
jgi:ubiquinone/menaquinone biosynthesis C-methylase UbiE